MSRLRIAQGEVKDLRGTRQLANTRNENQGRSGCISFPDLQYYELMHPLMHETSFVIGRDAKEIRDIRLDTLS